MSCCYLICSVGEVHGLAVYPDVFAQLQIPKRSMSAKAQGSTMCHWVAQIYISDRPGRKNSRP